MEEWRHWLEGAKYPFLVWTNHKNLEYIRKAKRLNSWQDQWALLLTRFNFTLSYCPGSWDGKPDALSWQFAVGKRNDWISPPVSILPPPCVVAVEFGIEEQVWTTAASHPGPSACPNSC